MDRGRLKFRVNGCQWEESSTFGHLRLDRGVEHDGVCDGESDDDSGCDGHMATLVVTMNFLVIVTSSNLDIPISIMMLMMMVAMMMYGFGENIL